METFTELLTTRKGTVGENIISDHLSRRQFAVYRPMDGVGHLVDFFAWKPGEPLQAIEVKTCPRLIEYDSAGMDLPDFNKYCALGVIMPVKVFFVDEIEQMIYWNEIEVLERFKMVYGNRVYFPLGCMRRLRRLRKYEIENIRKASTVDRSQYENVKRFFKRNESQ